MDDELRRIFNEEADARARDLERAAFSGPLERDTIFRHAHSLKGLAGTFGHARVASMAERVASELQDRLGRPRTLTEAEERRVKEEIRTLVDEIARLTRR